MKVYVGILLFILGQVFAWFQLNSQLISEWWRDKWLLSAAVIGMPASIFFWYAWKCTVEATGSAWSARFIGSATGLILFPFLTWYFLSESMFTVKTMICFLLSIIIIFIQLYAWQFYCRAYSINIKDCHKGFLINKCNLLNKEEI